MPIFDKVVDAPSEEGISPDSGTPDFAAIKQRIYGTRDKSTRPKKRTTREPEDTTTKELEEIFAGENWEEVAALYFNTRFVVTGWEGFQLDERQRRTLGLSLGTTMKMLLKIDPGYVAMIIFLTNFGGIIAQKEMVYARLLKEAEKERGSKVS